MRTERYLFGKTWCEPYVVVVNDGQELQVDRVSTRSFFGQNQRLTWHVPKEKLNVVERRLAKKVREGGLDWRPGAQNDVEVD